MGTYLYRYEASRRLGICARVNLMNQHLGHITLAGSRKYDYPLTFTYHEPWWNDYKYINDHYARLSVTLPQVYRIMTF